MDQQYLVMVGYCIAQLLLYQSTKFIYFFSNPKQIKWRSSIVNQQFSDVSFWSRKGGTKEERRKETSVFFIANTLFFSGREFKRQKYISAQPLPWRKNMVVDTVVMSSFFSLCISSLLSSLLPFSCSLQREPQHETNLLSTKVKDKGFDCMSIPHIW